MGPKLGPKEWMPRLNEQFINWLVMRRQNRQLAKEAWRKLEPRVDKFVRALGRGYAPSRRALREFKNASVSRYSPATGTPSEWMFEYFLVQHP
jgi:hypothetical protein